MDLVGMGLAIDHTKLPDALREEYERLVLNRKKKNYSPMRQYMAHRRFRETGRRWNVGTR